ncbi:DUF2254 domain-containing protein [Bacillus marinisedimentorum]|uniref:DUF2254 domain-containing protein n=1 Tax=Bacillus marinisedimentorum TaxID=1821260 RepID=UPI000871F0DC|nr:DUF2254 domain-containing protein [Bacillus marinisedimentorum]
MPSTNEQTISQKMWLIPLLYFAGAVILSVITAFIDFNVSRVNMHEMFLTKTDTARAIHSSLVRGILTMTTITFSVTMVVLTTYTSQYSPRALQDFLSETFTQHVLGVFSAGVIVSLFNMLTLPDKEKVFLSPVIGVLAGTVALGYFLAFINHAANWLKVNKLIERITLETVSCIQTELEPAGAPSPSPWEKWELDDLQEQERFLVRAKKSGYIKTIDVEYLKNLSHQDNTVLRLEADIGDYIDKGMPILSYWNFPPVQLQKTSYLEAYNVGSERTQEQDIRFGIQKLSDIAVKSLSSGASDPATAIESIKRIGTVLAVLGQHEPRKAHIFDEHKQLRIIRNPIQFEGYLHLALYQIRHHIKGDVSVMSAVIDALYSAASVNGTAVKTAIWEYFSCMLEVFDIKKIGSYEREFLTGKIDKLKAVCLFDKTFHKLPETEQGNEE